MAGKRFGQWVPAVVSAALAAATLVVYSIVREDTKALTYLQIGAASLVPAVFPIIGRITKKDVPIYVGALVAVHIFLANDLGSALLFYDLIPAWDLIMHGFFGFVFAVIVSVFLKRWGELKKFGYNLLIFLSTAGAAALWEVWEYICDTLLDGDAQRVKEALANGTNPIADTMEDIMITLAGAAAFYIAAVIIGLYRSGKNKRR